GVCHPAQLADWKTSLHAGAMGPGVAGQLVEMARSDPETARECLSCHAPLAEQQPVIAGPKGLVANPRFDPALHRVGLVCAACHVRRHERFGPPRRDGSLVSEAP
ncbi:MAG: multiheme c-type cytochrome, partial [candidate division NC10 bacterium]